MSVLLTLSLIAPVTPPTAAAAAEPVLVASVDTRSGGTGARVLLGDVTGDGPPRPGHHAAHGDNDVIAVMDNELRFFEGSTGQQTRAVPLPHPEAHDTVIIANFRGTDRPRDEAQQVGLGDFRPDLPGLEVTGLDRVNRTPTEGKDSIYLVSATGQTLWKETRDTLGCWGSVLEPLHNWDGSYADQLLAWNRGCGMVAGIWDGHGHPLPQAKKHYNYTRYTAEEMPLELSRDHRADASSSLPRHNAAKAVDGDPETRWISSPFDLRPTWRVDLGRIRELTGIVVDLGARPRHLSYRVEASIDGRDWVTVVDQRTPQEKVQRTEFTGPGRYLRLVAVKHAVPVQLAGVRVLGSR